MMLRRLLMGLMMGVLVFGAVNVHAQDGDGVRECRASPTDDFYYYVTDADFEGCLNALYDEMLDRDNPEIYGDWGGATDIRINAAGDIQTADDGSSDWTDWGSFDTEESVPPQNNSSGNNNSDTGTDTDNSAQPEINDSAPLSMEEVFGLVEQDLDAFWSGVFADEGIDYQKPDLVLWQGYEMDTRCGIVPAEAGPLYCPFDATIYFPVDFSQWLYSMGDFAVAAAIAHEWGHAVQDQIGLLGGNTATIDSELQADCFAGAYAEYISNRSELLRLEEGDLEEGAETFFRLGDPEGTPWFDPNAHGSGSQREQAFHNGVEQGYTAC